MNLLKNKVFWGGVITFLIAGLGSITGYVSPQVASWIVIIVGGLTTIGHSTNVIKGV